MEELVALGLVTNDAFSAVRQFLRPAYKRKTPARTAARWSLFRRERPEPPPAEFVARQLLRRYGVVFRAILERERLPMPWRDLLRVYRTLELRGDVRGGRFVERFAGEQFAVPEAIPLMRKLRREGKNGGVVVAAADPLNLKGILTPDRRVPSTSLERVSVLD